jgi:pyruvate/2-oxoglutarate dehydrogenase complex dihydrolipoamide acyltransferase (E2) component
LKQVELQVPKLGMDTTEAVITVWMVAEGAQVEIGSPLVELETEKVNFVVESEVKGSLAKILHQAGEVVAIGGVLGILETE